MLQDWRRKLRFSRQKATFKETVDQDAEADSTRDSYGPVMLLDPDVLECPICYMPLKIPIFQCDNGHLACSPCCKKVKNICPSCTLPIGYSRCRAMEKVIESSRMSCPNAKYGCKENTSYGNRSNHEKQCPFVPCSCPIRDCSYTGSNMDLYIHVRVMHKDDLTLFLWDFTFVIECDLSKKKIIILQEEDDGELIVAQVFSGSNGVFVVVSCIAPIQEGRFSCTLQFATSSIRLKQSMMLREIQKVGDEQPEDGFMFIPSYMLLPSDANLKIGICISRGDVHLVHA